MATSNDRLFFVGSVPLPDSETVFRALGREVGPFLRRIPDGETGERRLWVRYQQTMLENHPDVEVDPTNPPLPVRQSDGTVFRHINQMRLKPDVDPDRVRFKLGYTQAALQSYAVFKRLRDEGAIPQGVRFQFALPSPLATGFMYVSPGGRERYQRAYERALLGELAEILAAIPHPDIAIPFDVCQEVLMFEHYFPVRPPDYKEIVFGTLGRLAAAVPTDVELGYHLCYGSPGDQPLIRLRDAGTLTEMMNGIGAAVRRRIDFIHIPVPKDADDAFFAPLAGWHRPAGTRLFLGLLQHKDAEGDRRRIAAARKVVADFGVGAECGFGRTDPARVPAILAGHRAAAELLAGA
jgi:hypothetical protein